MSYLELTNTITGSGRRVYHSATTPSNGTDAVQELDITGTPTGGTFRLLFQGHRTAALDHDISHTDLEAALEAVASIGTGNVTVTGSGDGNDELPYTITFVGDLGARAVPLLEAVDVALEEGTDPEVEITEDTPGVDGTRLDLGVGALLVDDSTGKLYINTGEAGNPTWTVVGTQS